MFKKYSISVTKNPVDLKNFDLPKWQNSLKDRENKCVDPHVTLNPVDLKNIDLPKWQNSLKDRENKSSLKQPWSKIFLGT